MLPLTDPCEEGEFYCSEDVTCIEGWKQCDGYVDCKVAKEDEISCKCHFQLCILESNTIKTVTQYF